MENNIKMYLKEFGFDVQIGFSSGWGNIAEYYEHNKLHSGFMKCDEYLDQASIIILRCVIPVVCRKTNGEVDISHKNTTMVVWIYDGA